MFFSKITMPMVTTVFPIIKILPGLSASGFIPEQEKYGGAYARAVIAPLTLLLGSEFDECN